MMFLDCPAYLDDQGAARCGLPAEVRCRFTVQSTDGPVGSAMIRCPAGHWIMALSTGPSVECMVNRHLTSAGSPHRAAPTWSR